MFPGSLSSLESPTERTTCVHPSRTLPLLSLPSMFGICVYVMRSTEGPQQDCPSLTPRRSHVEMHLTQYKRVRVSTARDVSSGAPSSSCLFFGPSVLVLGGRRVVGGLNVYVQGTETLSIWTQVQGWDGRKRVMNGSQQTQSQRTPNFTPTTAPTTLTSSITYIQCDY